MKNLALVLLGFATLLALVFVATLFPGTTVYRILTTNHDDLFETAEEELEEIAIQLGRYQTTTGTYPTTEQGLEALVERPSIPPIPKEWIQKLESIPLDPWGNPYVYTFDPDEIPGYRIELFSLGPDGEESDDDVDSDIEF